MKKWKLVTKQAPPVNTTVWGYDVMYEHIHICSWDGKNRNDDEQPFPEAIDQNGDDYSIKYWMEKEQPPSPPNIDLEWVDSEGEQCLQCKYYEPSTSRCVYKLVTIVAEDNSCSQFTRASEP